MRPRHYCRGSGRPASLWHGGIEGIVYGGVDMYGWNPRSTDAATDVARDAAQPFFGRSFAVRVAPGLLEDTVSAEALADALASAASERWDDLHAAVQTLALPEGIRKDLDRLDSAKSGKKSKVIAYTDLYGEDGEQRPRGVVFVAPFGITVDAADGVAADSGAANSTEDDAAGSTPGYALSLARHSADVESRAEASAASAGLPVDRINDLKVAGYLHDAGKADLRFQAWLNYGDPFGPDLDEAGTILAKSGRRLPRLARERSGLPEHWRHEALSVRLAAHSGRLVEASDRELVLWLLGTHHGYGRPLFPHEDPDDAKPRMVPAVDGGRFEMPPGAGPQSLAFDWNGLDWPSLFVRLKERRGVWELARMEAILRLADHRASEERAKAAAEDSQ